MGRYLKKKLINIYEQFYEKVRRLRLDLRYRFRVMSMEDTIAYIKKNSCSIARFGDGEFGLIIGSRTPSFQSKDAVLAERLKEVCLSKDSRLLICLPHSFKYTYDCNEFAAKFWNWWLWDNNNLEKVAICLELSPWHTRTFGDSQITRPYMDWKDKSSAGKRFALLMSLWECKDIIIIEGEQTKLGVGNDLLDRASSVKRIICPSKDAFTKYDKILYAAEQCKRDSLILIALGPTATVLAYDLAIKGYQALDIGHIDIEYEWFRKGVLKKIAIPGKFTQEAHENIDIEITDKKYLEEIIMRIS